MKNLAMNQITVSSTDIEKSFDFYLKLGLHPIVKSDQYIRFIVPGNESTFSIHLSNSVNSTTTVYFEVRDVDKTFLELRSKGFDFEQEPVDQRWKWREAYLNDPDGNKICIYNAGKVRINPEWRLPESKENHLLSNEQFKEWLENYKHAWENESPQYLTNLFTDDLKYYENPFEEPSIGKDHIIKFGEIVPNGQTNIKFDYEILKTYDNVGYCKWNASFTRKSSRSRVLLDGIFEVTFDESGKGKSFKEWCHKKET